MTAETLAARAMAQRIHEDLQELIRVPEPRGGRDPNDSDLAKILSRLGTDLFRFATYLEGHKPDVLADVLAGVACCLAGMRVGVEQQDCQYLAREVMRSLREDVPMGIARVDAGEDAEAVIDDLSSGTDPENN